MSNSPEQTSAIRTQLIHRLLNAAVTITCLGYVYQFNTYSNKTFSLLWGVMGYSEQFAEVATGTMIVLLLLSAGCIWIRQTRYLALSAVAVYLVEVMSQSFLPAAQFPFVYPFEWALRYVTPVAAVLLYSKSERCHKSAYMIMKVAISVTFAAHGVKALAGYATFIDYLLVFFNKIGFENLTEKSALMVLHMIGTIDIFLAQHLLFFKKSRTKYVIMWMAVWGLITALSRVVYGGFESYHEVLIRSTHFLTPLAYALMLNIKRPKK